ncbi:helix-turn-helix transcriptional regulator [Staphylococcus lugdunensis]|nr:helix-turn-helix transcriptional regulator [Staphylococcus lugdunensis]MDU1593012.1 helix-turn-helix transcriptional regulator [Staphylococcus lugdunensis]MDU4335571.1 helix-turn-helix transcriptional regulator [Staphylococcus lugdunensis]MDU4448576.1 helix-turn-helix transcriptional regulator [Staphylococcus lugdunensis]
MKEVVTRLNKVKVYRGYSKISQLELARAVGVSRQTINMIENGKYNPSLKLCVNIAKTLGTTLDTLFWENDI